jgi:hypothetical protein
MKRTIRRRGQGIVEMALVLPIFLVTILGIMDFGRAFHCWTNINHQCIEAVRVACKRKYLSLATNLYTSTTHADTQIVLTEFWKSRSPLTPIEKMTGPTLEGVGTSAEKVKISVTFLFEPWTPGIGLLLGTRAGTGLALTASAEQYKE